MKNSIPVSEMKRIVKASKNSMLRTLVEDVVSKNFRSVHLLASELVVDAIVLNVMLNDEIAVHSADEIIMSIKRETNSFYINAESAYRSVATEFDNYAERILKDEYENALRDSLRTVNFIVYVMSRDVASRKLNREEIIMKAYSFDEVLDGKVPHY